MTENLIYSIGFQPFMRCSVQNGYRIQDKELCRKKLEIFCVDGKKKHILSNRFWHLGRNRKRKVDDAYHNFSVENQYGIRVMKRSVYFRRNFRFKKMYELYMLTDKSNTQEPGIRDFRPREI